MAKLRVFPTEIEVGDIRFGDQWYLGLRATDARSGDEATICLHPDAVAGVLRQIERFDLGKPH